MRSRQELVSLAGRKCVCAATYSLHGRRSSSRILEKSMLRASYPQVNTSRPTSLKHKTTSFSHETRGLHALSRELSKTKSHSTFRYSLLSIYLSRTTGSPPKETPSARRSEIFHDCIIIGLLHHLPSHRPYPATESLIQSLQP